MGKITKSGGMSDDRNPDVPPAGTLQPDVVPVDRSRHPDRTDQADQDDDQREDDDVSTDPGNVTHGIGGGTTGEVPGDAPEGGNPPPADPDAFNADDHTVDEVLEYLRDLDDDDAGQAERARVIQTERAGKGRVTILALDNDND